MPEIVVKGMDSAEAMEQVTKLLGADALILSTVKRGNMVEITATDEPVEQMPKPAASSALETPSGFAQVLAKTLKKVEILVTFLKNFPKNGVFLD